MESRDVAPSVDPALDEREPVLNLRRTQMTGNPGHKKRRLVSESTVRRERGLLRPSSSEQLTRATTSATRSAASSAGRTRLEPVCSVLTKNRS